MRELMGYLPECYEASPEMIAIQRAIQPELDLAWAGRDDLLLQLNPNTATWGLNYWESAFGLPVSELLPLSIRRNRVIARIRGRGTTTVAVLKSVVETFCPGCEVSIIEHYGEYVVEIHLTITDQAIEDSPGLKDELNLIMPAHLAWGFSITLETTGGIIYGICSEMAGRIDIWPRRVTEIRTTGKVAVAGALLCQGVVEIFPEGGVTNV